MACCARPRRPPRYPHPAPQRRPPRAPPPLPPPGPPPPRRAGRLRSARHCPPAPQRRRPPRGCWPHSPRPSPRSRRQLPTAEMARCCRLHPPDHSPACPRGPRGGRTPPTSCPRTLSLPCAVPFPSRGLGKVVSGAGMEISRPGVLAFLSWELSLLLRETVTFPLKSWKFLFPNSSSFGGLLLMGQ
uniref:Uncharacterized protein n=1 Tax=Ursus americanus TaxID=9643 RepID=A0A452SV40_URSAM